jgi:Skp family chaperone for outer membrane proteins
VKRKAIVAAAGVAVVGALIYVGSLWAQTSASSVPAKPAAAPRTKIALLNLTYVISYYHKYQAYKEEMKGIAKPFEDQIKGKQAELEALRKEATAPGTATARVEELQKQAKALQFEMENVSTDAKSKLAKKAEGQMVELYKEVQDAARRYAVSHDFDMVLQYNEPIEKDAYYTAPNVERKMGAGALIPMHYSNENEISYDVMNALNAAYHPATPAAHTGTPAAGVVPASHTTPAN